MNNEQGSTLLVIAMTVAFFSLVTVLFVQYVQWQGRLNAVPEKTINSHEALRFARHRLRNYFRKNLSDTGLLPGPVERTWKLEPSLEVSARVTSLNRKLNLNRLVKGGTESLDVKILEPLLKEFGYPDRTLDELKEWTTPEEDRNPDPSYAGYGYRAPGRKLYHMDEVSLVSGFIQIGVPSRFRQVFTVHGTGRFNPLHLTPDEWSLLASAPGVRLPELPSEASQSQEAFREFLNQRAVWSRIQDRFPFMTKRDDSFQVDYTIESGLVHRRYRAIYVYEYLDDTLTVETRYPLLQEEDSPNEEETPEQLPRTFF